MNDSTHATDGHAASDDRRTNRSIRKARRLADLKAREKPPETTTSRVPQPLPSDPIDLAALIETLKKEATEMEDRLFVLRTEVEALEARHALLSVLGGMPEPGVAIIGGCAMGVVTMFVVAAMT